MIYLDNAATSGKKPPEVKRAVFNALERYSANPGRGGHKSSLAASEAVYNVREKANEFFGGYGSENVVFTANCTHALNFVIKGVLNKGEHAVVSDLEHNAVMRPLKYVTDNISLAEVSLTDDDETVDNYRKLIKDDTKLVISTAASNVAGKTLPLKRIGQLCKERGIPFLVDGAQGGGVLPVNMSEMNIDYLCIAPHKGLYAPMSNGILLAKTAPGKTVIEGGNGADSLSLTQTAVMPQGFESGTVSVPSICGIGAGIDFVNRIGRQKIYEWEAELINYLYDNLSAVDNVILYAPKPVINQYAPVLSFNVAGKNSEEIASILDKNNIAVRAGFHCSKSAHEKLGTTDKGTVRVSPSAFNNKKEIDFLCEIIKKI